jgi:cytoskeletal protein RodZ
MAVQAGVASTDASEEGKFLGWWKTISGAVVVVLALGALVWSTHLVLDNFKTTTTCEKACQEERGNEGEGAITNTASVSASSAVAVLTPVIAGIVGIAGLFFGLSATGSAKGQKVQGEQQIAKSEAESTSNLSEALKVAVTNAAPPPPAGDSKPEDPGAPPPVPE